MAGRSESALADERTPAAGPVIGDDLLEHRQERLLVDRYSLTDRDRARRLVVVPCSDDSFWIRHDPAIVEKYVHVVLCCEQRADVSVQDEVRLNRSLYGLDHFLVRGVDQIPDLSAKGLLPVGQRIDVLVDPRISGVAHGWFTVVLA